MFNKTSSSKTTGRPTVPAVTQDPRYIHEDQKLQVLRGRLDAVERQVQRRHDDAAAPADVRLRRLLEDPSGAVPRRDAGVVTPDVLQDERRLLAEAVAEQEKVRTRIECETSAETCRDLLPYHRHLAARLAAALQEFSAVQEEIDRWQQDLDDAGLKWSPHLRPLTFRVRGLRGLENPVDHETVAFHLADLREHGLLDH